jgi:hypothetical protein
VFARRITAHVQPIDARGRIGFPDPRPPVVIEATGARAFARQLAAALVGLERSGFDTLDVTLDVERVELTPDEAAELVRAGAA